MIFLNGRSGLFGKYNKSVFAVVRLCKTAEIKQIAVAAYKVFFVFIFVPFVKAADRYDTPSFQKSFAESLFVRNRFGAGVN